MDMQGGGGEESVERTPFSPPPPRPSRKTELLKGQFHDVFNLFLYDSNSFEPLIHVLKYFRIWIGFSGDIRN